MSSDARTSGAGAIVHVSKHRQKSGKAGRTAGLESRLPTCIMATVSPFSGRRWPSAATHAGTEMRPALNVLSRSPLAPSSSCPLPPAKHTHTHTHAHRSAYSVAPWTPPFQPTDPTIAPCHSILHSPRPPRTDLCMFRSRRRAGPSLCSGCTPPVPRTSS